MALVTYAAPYERSTSEYSEEGIKICLCDKGNIGLDARDLSHPAHFLTLL